MVTQQAPYAKIERLSGWAAKANNFACSLDILTFSETVRNLTDWDMARWLGGEVARWLGGWVAG